MRVNPTGLQLSRGYHDRVIVEVELSSNGKHWDGLTSQLPTYLNAEKARHGLLLLIKVGDHEKRLQRIKKEHARLRKSGHRVPDLLVIDA